MINKKTQKILAMLIVAVLTFGMLVPVSAASEPQMKVIENQTFDQDVSGGWDQEGKWDIKGAKKNEVDETSTSLAKVEGGKLVSKRDWNADNNAVIAEYYLKKESYGTKKLIVSFDVQAKNVDGTLINVYAGTKESNPNNGPTSLYVLNLDSANGYLYVNSWTDVAYTSIKDDVIYNLEMTFDMDAGTVTLRYKKSTDADYTTHSTAFAFKASLGDNAIKKLAFGSGVLGADSSYSVDNVVVSYKSETKIQADLTVKDGENEIADINNIPAGKNLKVTPVFKNIGNRKADGVVLIVAWYSADGTLKDAFVEIDSAGLAAGATNSDLGDITFTAATEEGDYIKAFAWDSFATLKPYNLVYAE